MGLKILILISNQQKMSFQILELNLLKFKSYCFESAN